MLTVRHTMTCSGPHRSPGYAPRRAHLVPVRRLPVAAAAAPPGSPSVEEGRLLAPRANGNAGASNILPFRLPGSHGRLADTDCRRVQTPLRLAPPETEVDGEGHERLRLQEGGWREWEWRGHKINFLTAGERGPPVVLVHGYGGSVYHFRYNIPQLSKQTRVFALDCLGFGWSDKPIIDYNGIWAEQIADFVHEVVGEAAVLVGHSLGGYSTLHTAALKPQVAKGVVLLNAAGAFQKPRQVAATATGAAVAATAAAAAASEFPQVHVPLSSADMVPGTPTSAWRRLFERARDAALRAVVGAYYRYMKQQKSIEKALKKLYVHPHRVDEDLVRSVAIPAADPAAEEVLFLLLRAAMSTVPLNSLLDSVAHNRTPLLLLWGDKDPWTLRDVPHRIRTHYPAARLEWLPCGHCPMDDTPQLVNEQLLTWIHDLEEASHS